MFLIEQFTLMDFHLSFLFYNLNKRGIEARGAAVFSNKLKLINQIDKKNKNTRKKMK